jgi:hypothetical protein
MVIKTASFNLLSTVTPVNNDLDRHLQLQQQQQLDRLRSKRKNYEDQDEDTIEFNATGNTIDSMFDHHQHSTSQIVENPQKPQDNSNEANLVSNSMDFMS